MNVSAFIAKRVALNRQHSFSRFIIRLAIAATVISVAAMLLTVAFTNGFQYAISQKVFSFWGNIRVQRYEPDKVSIAEETPIQVNDTVLNLLHSNKNIKSIQAFGTKNAIVKGTESIEGVLLKGVEKSYDFSNVNTFLKSGRWINFPDTGYSNEINLSAYTANQLKLKVNDKVFVYFIQTDGSRRVRQMTVAGIFKTGIEDYDKLIAVCDLALIQRLNNWNKNEIGGYEIFVKDISKIDSVNNEMLRELPQEWNSRTIMDVYQNIFDWLNLQDKTIAIVIIIMTIVAILNLITCLLILALERTHMVGILKAIGARDSTVQRIFLYHGAIITVSGIMLGNIFGLLICWLQQKYGFITLPEESYFISKAIVKLEWWHVALINAGTFITCFLTLIIPTIIIRKMQPVKAI
ncbi:MAG: ABC transporter permease, partial [Bacteroidetes bacterium]|nr:ABC transporter permease [Bacteroidota bacterium]